MGIDSLGYKVMALKEMKGEQSSHERRCTKACAIIRAGQKDLWPCDQGNFLLIWCGKCQRRSKVPVAAGNPRHPVIPKDKSKSAFAQLFFSFCHLLIPNPYVLADFVVTDPQLLWLIILGCTLVVQTLQCLRTLLNSI